MPDDALNHAAGAEAIAFVTAPDGDVSLPETASFVREYPGTRFRRRGSAEVEDYGATAYERDAYTSAVAGAVKALDLDSEPDAVVLTAPDGSLPARGRGTLPFDAIGYHLADELGDLARRARSSACSRRGTTASTRHSWWATATARARTPS